MAHPRITLLLLLALAACRRHDPEVLLAFGDQTVQASEFQAQLDRIEQRGTPVGEDVRRALLQTFLEERVLVLEARRRGFVKAGTSIEAEREAVERLVAEAALTDATPSEAEIEAYYQTHLAEFQVPEEVELRHILVPTTNQLRDVRRRLAKDPTAFESLARSLSQSPEASEGGNLGRFQRGQLPEPLEAVAFSLAVGEIGDATTPLGYHILKVEAHHPARETSLDEARAGIRARLAREQSDQQVRRFVSDLLSRAKVNYEAARTAAPSS